MKSKLPWRAIIVGCTVAASAIEGAAEEGPDLIENGAFDSTTIHWMVETGDAGTLSWSTADASGNPHSGSARLTTDQTEVVIGEPCIEVEPEDTFILRGSVWVDEARSGDHIRLGFAEFSDSSCSQLSSLLFTRFLGAELTVGRWQDLVATGSSFGSTTWLRPTLWLEPTPGSSIDAYFDEIQLRSATCVPGPATLCLDNGRFRVTSSWRAADQTSGVGQAVPFADESGSFWFFSPTNLELNVKVLDGCVINQRFWVFAAGLTDVEVYLSIQDTETGQVWSNQNSLGQTFVTVTDTDAFATCP